MNIPTQSDREIVIAREIERTEAQVGRCMTDTEKMAFAIGYSAGYAACAHLASKEIDSLTK